MTERPYLQERLDRILVLLQEHGRVSVTELSKRFGVSAVTVRNDLATLEQVLVSLARIGRRESIELFEQLLQKKKFLGNRQKPLHQAIVKSLGAYRLREAKVLLRSIASGKDPQLANLAQAEFNRAGAGL